MEILSNVSISFKDIFPLITGRRYEVSNSQYFFGQIVSGNEVVDE